MPASIAALFVYPVKGCRGIALSSGRVTERGLEHDREWMVVDTSGRFVTQRTEPRLASIATAISATSLTLTVPGAAPLEVPLDQSGVASAVTVWRDTRAGNRSGTGGGRVALGAAESVPTGWSASIPRPGGSAIPNMPAIPAHTRRSPMAIRCWCCRKLRCDDLNARLAAPLPIDPFSSEPAAVRCRRLRRGLHRPDRQRRSDAENGQALHALPGDDDRSADAAERGLEPLCTLAGYRHNALLGGVAFGMNAIVAAGAGGTLTRARSVAHSVPVLIPGFRREPPVASEMHGRRRQLRRGRLAGSQCSGAIGSTMPNACSEFTVASTATRAGGQASDIPPS